MDSRFLLSSFLVSDASHFLFRHILSSSKLPSYVLNSCIGAYTASRNPKFSVQTFGKMKSLGNFGKALGLIKEMENYNLKADRVCSNTIIDGLCKKGLMNKALDSLLDMMEKGFVPDEVSFTSLISGYCKLIRIKEAKCVLQMGTMCFPIDGLCRIGDVEKASMRLISLMSLQNVDFCPIKSHTATIIMGCIPIGKIEKALLYFKKMVESSFKTYVKANKAVIRGLRNLLTEGRIECANELIAKI